MTPFVWNETDDGDFAHAMVHPGKVSDLVRVFDPNGPHVFVIGGFTANEWSLEALPSFAAKALAMTDIQVLSAHFRLLLPVRTFLDCATELGRDGLFAAQCLNEPPANELRDPSEMTDRALAWWLQAAGVQIAIDVPHEGESARLIAPTAAMLEAASSQFG